MKTKNLLFLFTLLLIIGCNKDDEIVQSKSNESSIVNLILEANSIEYPTTVGTDNIITLDTELPFEIQNVKIKALEISDNATVNVSVGANFSVSQLNIPITVTAENGADKTNYNLKLKRETLEETKITFMKLITQGEEVELEINNFSISGELPIDLCYTDLKFEYKLSENSESLAIDIETNPNESQIKLLRTEGITIRLKRKKDNQLTDFNLKILPNSKSAVICNLEWNNINFNIDIGEKEIFNENELSEQNKSLITNNGFKPSFNFLGNEVQIKSSTEVIGKDFNSIENQPFNISGYTLKISSLDNSRFQEYKIYANMNFDITGIEKVFKTLNSNLNNKYIYIFSNDEGYNRYEISHCYLHFYDISKNEIDVSKTIRLPKSAEIYTNANKDKIYYVADYTLFEIDDYGIVRKLFYSNRLSRQSSGKMLISDNTIWSYMSNGTGSMYKINLSDGSTLNSWDSSWSKGLNYDSNQDPISLNLEYNWGQLYRIFGVHDNTIINAGPYGKWLFNSNEITLSNYYDNVFDKPELRNKTAEIKMNSNGFQSLTFENGIPNGYHKIGIFGRCYQSGDNLFISNITSLIKYNFSTDTYINLEFPYPGNNHYIDVLHFDETNNNLYLAFHHSNTSTQFIVYNIDSKNYNEIQIPTNSTRFLGSLIVKNGIIYSINSLNTLDPLKQNVLSKYNNTNWEDIILKFK